MSRAPASRSRLGRVLGAFARIGLDLRPLAERMRAAILRPLRHELEQSSTDIRNDLAREIAETQSGIAQLRRELGQAVARSDALTAQLAVQGHTLRKEVAKLQVAVDVTARGQGEAMLGLDALRSVFDRSRDETASFRGELGALQSAAVEAARTASDLPVVGKKVSELLGQLTLLERLFTENAAISSLPLDADPDAGPVVSVILPTRNRAHVIAAAVASVQAQRYSNWELIIVDDGSDDTTAKSLAPFLHDKRIHVARQPATGTAVARNHGLKLARAGLIAYLDSDNVWYPDFLASAVTAFGNPDVEVAYGALVTESHGLDGSRIFYKPFDRAALLENNFIDLNTLVHRRELVDRYGGFDERLDRLVDWDLVLRYTADRAPAMLPILAARYSGDQPDRITTTVAAGPNWFEIKRKWRVLPDATRQLRVLYVVWHYPQLSESYVETEIQCMLRWGVHIEVWCETGPAASYPSSVPVHRGTLDEAIVAVRPDLLHIHWIHFGHQQIETFERHGLPMTARAHGFEFSPDNLSRVLAWPWMQRVYLFPHQQVALDAADPRVRVMTSAFDTTLFKPHVAKDRRLVVRTSAGLPSKDLQFIFELAKRATNYRFVVAVSTCKDAEGYIDTLRDDWRQSGTPAELLVDVPRGEIAALLARAGHYLHTLRGPGESSATAIGMPISIAEAMATGSHVLVRDIPALTGYVADAGAGYRDMDHAAEILQHAAQWGDSDWQRAWIRSVDRAFLHHADETVLLPLLQDWCGIAEVREIKIPRT